MYRQRVVHSGAGQAEEIFKSKLALQASTPETLLQCHQWTYLEELWY